MNKVIRRKAFVNVESYSGVKRFLSVVTKEGDLYWATTTTSSSGEKNVSGKAYGTEQKAVDAAEGNEQSWLTYNKEAVEV